MRTSRTILERLFPREGGEFFDFFENHAEKTLEAVRLLRVLVEDPGSAVTYAAQIKTMEHEADEITHHTIEALHHVFLTPIDRGDIHRLISRLDDILDLVESTSERLSLYEIREIEPDAIRLVEVLSRAVAQVREVMRRLRNVRQTEPLVEACREIGQLEKEGDRLVRQAVARLFDPERDPVHVIMWKEIYRYLEEAIDRCEDVADVVEGIAIGFA